MRCTSVKYNYIRTRDNIYEIESTYKHLGKTYYGVKGHISTYSEEEIVNKADTIKELCDCYIITDKDDKYPFITKEVDNLHYANNKDRHNFEIYGAIWTKGKHGEPILKAVTKPMNEKGELELLWI